jgi:hypothetical protein
VRIILIRISAALSIDINEASAGPRIFFENNNKNFLNFFFVCVCVWNSRLIWRMLFVFGGQGNIEASQGQIYLSELKLEIERERERGVVHTHTRVGLFRIADALPSRRVRVMAVAICPVL